MVKRFWAAVFLLMLLGTFAREGRATPLCSATAKCVTGLYQFTSASGNTAQNVYQAPSSGNGSEIIAIYCTSATTLAAANSISILQLHSAVSNLLAQPTIPAAWGQAGSPTANILNTTNFGNATAVFSNLPTDVNGNNFIILAPSDWLQLKMGAALTGSDTVNCNAQIVQY